MTVTRYATALVHPAKEPEFRAYLYDHTQIVSSVMVDDNRLAHLVTATTAFEEDRADYLQQYQCDRLASGMFGQVIGFNTLKEAKSHADGRSAANDWIQGSWHDVMPLGGTPTHVVVDTLDGYTWSRDEESRPFNADTAVEYARERNEALVTTHRSYQVFVLHPLTDPEGTLS